MTINVKKYINSFSLHFYAIVSVVVFLLSFQEVTKTSLCVTFFILLPLVLAYLYRIKNMKEEEIVEKFGFTGNKFLDPNID